MPKAKVVFYPAPEFPLEQAEIQKIFSKFGPKDPVMVAYRQILVERLAIATVDSTDSRLDARGAGMAAGRILEISSLQQELEALMRPVLPKPVGSREVRPK